MLFGNLKRLIILGAIVKFASCEETDAKSSSPAPSSTSSSDATSRIRFVQYQSDSPKAAEHTQTEKTASAIEEPEAKSSDAHVTRHLSRRQDQLSRNDDKEPSLVPKNYAFAYAIRDRNSGDDFSHTQAHNGRATKGQYRVKLPDGRVQVVTYTADNGGYRADIHYDKGNPVYEGQADDSLAYLQRAAERPSAAAANTALVKTDSPLLYFNEMRSFGVTTTGQPPASYETVEHIEEDSQQNQQSNEPRLVDDVNYLLKYIAPTVESRTENVFDITPDSLRKRQYLAQQAPSTNDNERLGRFKFELPADFPFRGTSSETKKYGTGSGSNESAQKVNFSEFTSQRPAIYRTSETPLVNRSPAPVRRPQILLPLRMQPQFVNAKYESQDQSRYSIPKYESQDQSGYSIPKYESQDQSRYSIPKYESEEQLRFTNLKYDPRAPAQFTNPNAVPQFANANSASLSTETESHPYPPRFESQEQSPLSSPKYSHEQQNLSQYESKETAPKNSLEQSKYTSSLESSLPRIPTYGPNESALLNIKTDTRLFPQKTDQPNALRYTPKSELRDQIQPPKYDSRAPPYVTTPRYEGEKDSSAPANVGKYEPAQGLPELVLKFENREQSPFETPKVDPQKFRPSQPFVPRNQDRPLFAPYSPYLSEYASNPPSTSKYQHFEEINYESSPVDGASIESPKTKFTSQETLPQVPPLLNYNSQEQSPPIASLPRYIPKEGSDDLHPNTPTVPLYIANSDPGRPTAQFGKIEIPQYLHIHQYDSGEDAKSREIVYYTPLQIPIPNSVAYMERGNQTDVKSNPYASLTPAYVTMTEHPHSPGDQSSQYPEGVSLHDQSRFELPSNLTSLYANHEAPADQPETESPDYRHLQVNDLRFATRPAYKDIRFNARPLQPPAPRPQAPHVTTESSAEEHREPMRYFDPRTYSGYFDFLSSPELQEEKPSAEGNREPEQNQPVRNSPPPPPPQPPSPPASRANPPQSQQYRPNYATATPSYRYKGAGGGGREGNALFDSDPLRNTSFRASAYLRPLHKERVYIHHNSQPTAPTADDHYSGIASTTRMHKKTADISIVKSISSTISPELLKDFDYQLAASVLQDAVHEGSELGAKGVTAALHSKLDKSIVKKLQNALSTNGKIYFKSPTQQERTVS